jgi:hypothetical protein
MMVCDRPKRIKHPKPMSKEELLLEYWHDLLPEQRRELINFAEYLHGKVASPQPRPNIKGLCRDTATDLSLEDFTQARQEAWANFPREEFYL